MTGPAAGEARMEPGLPEGGVQAATAAPGSPRESWREGPERERRGGATQALEDEGDGEANPEMNMLCDAESDGEKGLFGLREVGEIDVDEATAAFSASEEESDGGDVDVGGVHMLVAAGAVRPGPTYWWCRLGGQEGYTKIMIDSGSTVSDLVSEEFADQLGLEGEMVTGCLI